MKIKVLILLLLTLLVFSCKKQDETVIKLTVSSFVNSSAIVDADVSFYVKALNNNTYSSSYDFVESGVTEWNGVYSVVVNKTSSDIAYRFVVSKDNYLTKEVEINPSDISASQINSVQMNCKPLAELTFHIVSGVNAQINDQIFFNYNNDSEVGQSFNGLSFFGNQIDTTLMVQVLAEKYNQFTYVLNRNGNYTQFEDSIHCPIGGSIFKFVEL